MKKGLPMKRFFCFLLLTASILIGASAFAENQNQSGGAGINLFPLENDQIELTEESIVMQQIDGGWRVETIYQFRNPTDQPQQVVIGFPYKVYPMLGDASVDMIPQQMRRNMEFLVRGSAMKPGTKELVKKENADSLNASPFGESFYYSHAFTWTVDFAPTEPLEIVHRYEIAESLNEDESRWVEYNPFVGKPWRGNQIGKLKMEVRFAEETLPCDELSTGLTGQEPSGFYPCFTVYVGEKHQAFKRQGQGKHRKLIWQGAGKDVPKFMIAYYVPKYIFWGTKLFGEIDRNGEQKQFSSKSCEELRRIRNSYYALMGYVFSSSDLKAYFEKQPWYRADPEVDLKKLTHTQKNWINQRVKPIIALEREKGCKQ